MSKRPPRRPLTVDEIYDRMERIELSKRPWVQLQTRDLRRVLRNLAKLGAGKPLFYNPLDAMQAETDRDAVLRREKIS